MFNSFILSALCLMCTVLSYSQSETCAIDNFGCPVNPRGSVPDEEMSILATGCCCDFTWKTNAVSPPTTAANATRFKLTADSLFINIATVSGQNMDTVLYKLNQRKGSTMKFIYQTNANVFAEVELQAGSGVDMGTWWKFAIDYLDYPITPLATLTDKPFCVEWSYGPMPFAPKIFSCLLSQTGTADPSVIVLENTLGTISVTRVTTGGYLVSGPGLFTVNKTMVVTSRVLQEYAGEVYIDPAGITLNSIDIRTLSSGTDSDDELLLTPLIIYVYP